MRMVILMAIVIVTLFYLPISRWFSDTMVNIHSLGLTLYWVILTLLSIVIGFKILGKMMGGVR